MIIRFAFLITLQPFSCFLSSSSSTIKFHRSNDSTLPCRELDIIMPSIEVSPLVAVSIWPADILCGQFLIEELHIFSGLNGSYWWWLKAHLVSMSISVEKFLASLWVSIRVIALCTDASSGLVRVLVCAKRFSWFRPFSYLSISEPLNRFQNAECGHFGRNSSTYLCKRAE